MKSFLYKVISLTLILSALTTQTAKANPKEFCVVISEVSHNVMMFRQSGNAKDEAIKVIFNSKMTLEQMKMSKAIIDEAYSIPIVGDYKLISNMFAEKMYNICMQAIGPST